MCQFHAFLLVIYKLLSEIWVEIIPAFMQLQREFQSINKDEQFVQLTLL